MNLGKTGEIPSVKTEVVLDPKSINRMDVLIRDVSCWYRALLRRWWVILLLLILGSGASLGYRLYRSPRLYTSSCAMVRQEVADIRHSDLPINYSPMQMNVMFNMIRGHACLMAAARLLNLDLDHSQMYNSIDVRRAEKNSNYFFISAVSKDPQLSADMANAVAKSFIAEYEKMVQKSTEATLKGSEAHIAELKGDIAKHRLLLGEFYRTATKRRIDELENQLKNTPAEKVMYTERDPSGDKRLANERLLLQSHLQTYTDKNPIVENQRKLVAALEKEAAQNNDTLSKEVKGPNPEYVTLQSELTRVKAEYASMSVRGEYSATGGSDTADGEEKLTALRGQKELMDVLTPQMNLLREQIAQKKDLLLQKEALHLSLKQFMARSYTDVVTYENAQPPKEPIPRQLFLFAAIGALFGSGLGVFIVLFLELLNLTVRNKVDITKALHLRVLGILPVFSVDIRASYYSALQEVVTSARNYLEPKSRRPVVVLIAAPDAQTQMDETVFKDILEILYVKESLNYKVIKDADVADSSTQSKYLINDMVYGFGDELPAGNHEQPLYFHLNDLAFLTPPSLPQLETFREAMSGYDVILWETFAPEKHWQLFSDMFDFADMLILPACAGKTSKMNMLKIIDRLGADKRGKMFSVLYNMKKESKRGFLL